MEFSLFFSTHRKEWLSLKKTILITAASILAVILCLSASVFASSASGHPAVISNGNISLLGSYYIEGSIASASGNISFGAGSASSCILDGDAIVTDGHSVTFFNQWNMPDFRGEIVVSDVDFPYTPVSAPATPSGIASASSLPYNVTESVAVSSLRFGGDYTIDTSAGDVWIIADTVTFPYGSINVTGSNDAYIVVNNSITFSGGTEINSDGNLSIILGTGVAYNNYSVAYANLYVTDNQLAANGGGTLYGNIYLLNDVCSVSGNFSLYGTIYGSDTDISMSGAATVYGTVVADSFSNTGNFTIIYDPYYSLPDEGNSGNTGSTTVEDTSLILCNSVGRTSILGALSFDGAYIYGYNDTEMAPEMNVKRSEASAMLYRILKQNDELDGYVLSGSTFPDVSENDWFGSAIGFFEYIGVYNSNYGENYLSPENFITRGEAAKLFAFAMGISEITEDDVFSDVARSNRFYPYITALANEGLLVGNGDGTYSPDAYMTRAEYVTIFNRILGRDDRYDYTTDVDGNPVECQFADMDSSAWYYADMMRATNAFTNFKVDFANRAERNVLDDYTE